MEEKFEIPETVACIRELFWPLLGFEELILLFTIQPVVFYKNLTTDSSTQRDLFILAGVSPSFPGIV